MTTIDASTDIGKLRLRVADYSDIPFLPDSVYTQTLSDNSSNLPQCAIILATYILGMLAFKTHRKMGLQLEVWGKEAFDSYKEFLLLTITNPAIMNVALVPISTASDFNTLIQFQSDWQKNYFSGDQSQQLASDALASPNQGGLYGPTLDSRRWAD